MRYRYAAETFGKARDALMLPHPEGEAASIAWAFHEASLGLHSLDVDQIKDENVHHWLQILNGLMDTTGIKDPDQVGTQVIKARSLTMDDKFELARVLRELAAWFRTEAWQK